MGNAKQEEIVNMLRVEYVIIFPCTDLFRDILRHHVTEIQMTGRLLEKSTKGLLHSKKAILGADLKKILYPQHGCFTGDYTIFDLSALYRLIRNVSGIPGHHKGWGRPPDPSDRSVSANIDRLREIRNKYSGHCAGKPLEAQEFQTLWNEIETSIKELEQSLPGKSTKYKDDVTKWKTCPLDSTLPYEKNAILQEIISKLKEQDMHANEQVSEEFIPEDDRDAGGLPSSITISVGSRDKTLKGVKDMEGEQTLKIFLTVKVLEIMPPTTYTSKKGVSQMLTGIVADTEAYAEIHVYDVAKFPLFRVDEALIISDFIKKADGSLVITQISNVFTTYASIVNIPLEVKEAASKKSDCVSVLTAATSPLRSTVSVKGKVIFAGKSTTKRLRISGEEVAFKRLKVKDSTGVVNIALWRDFAESPIEKGSFVTLHNFQTTQTYDMNTKSQKPVLSNRSSKSAVEFIPSFDDISDDSNDSKMEEDSSLVGEILGIESLYTYRCCLIDKCCKKKVTMEFRCPTCGIQYTVQSAGHATILKLLIKGSEMTVFTTFTECINQLLNSMNIAMDLSNKEETLKSLKASLPIKVSYSFTGTKVTKLKKL